MPDNSGAFKGIAVPAKAWERVFGADDDVVPVRSRPVDECCGCGGCDDLDQLADWTTRP